MTGRLFGERNYNNCNKWRHLFLHVMVRRQQSFSTRYHLWEAFLSHALKEAQLTRLSLSDHVTIENQSNQEAWFIFSSHWLFWLNAISVFRVPVDKSFYYTCKLEMWYKSDEANWKQWYSVPKEFTLEIMLPYEWNQPFTWE